MRQTELDDCTKGLVTFYRVSLKNINKVNVKSAQKDVCKKTGLK